MSDRPNTDPPTKADVAATIDDFDTPLPLAALASPYALNAITDMDVHATDLVDEGTTLYDAAAREFPKARLGGPASSLSAHPLATSDLDDDAVTAAKVAVDAVANEHLQADAVDSAELANDAVQAAHIAASAVGSGQLATDAVTTGALAADAVTSSEIAADAVGSTHIAPGSVGSAQLGFDVATQSEFESHTLNATAHHEKPTSTQSEGGTTPGYLAKTTVGDVYGDTSGPVTDTTQQSVSSHPTLIDGVRVTVSGRNYDSNYSTDGWITKIEGQDSAGNWMTLWSGGELARTYSEYGSSTESVTWPARNLTSLRYSFYAPERESWSIDHEPHQVTLPEHSHQI